MLRTRMGVDAGNNDPVQFWRHAGAALDGRTADRVTALLRDVQLASFEAVATLVNKLAEYGQRGWLFHGCSGRRDPGMTVWTGTLVMRSRTRTLM
jgi:hypothetical protein